MLFSSRLATLFGAGAGQSQTRLRGHLAPSSNLLRRRRKPRLAHVRIVDMPRSSLALAPFTPRSRRRGGSTLVTPLDFEHRCAGYRAQNGARHGFTPRQRRRIMSKVGHRAAFRLRHDSTAHNEYRIEMLTALNKIKLGNIK